MTLSLVLRRILSTNNVKVWNARKLATDASILYFLKHEHFSYTSLLVYILSFAVLLTVVFASLELLHSSSICV